LPKGNVLFRRVWSWLRT